MVEHFLVLQRRDTHARPVENAYFVVEACVTVDWEEGGIPSKSAEFVLLAGTARAEDVRFQAA